METHHDHQQHRAVATMDTDSGDRPAPAIAPRPGTTRIWLAIKATIITPGPARNATEPPAPQALP